MGLKQVSTKNIISQPILCFPILVGVKVIMEFIETTTSQCCQKISFKACGTTFPDTSTLIAPEKAVFQPKTVDISL